MMTIISIIAGVILATMSNWLYDILKDRQVFPNKPSAKYLILLLVASTPLVVLVGLPTILENTWTGAKVTSTIITTNNPEKRIDGNRQIFTCNDVIRIFNSGTDKTEVQKITVSVIYDFIRIDLDANDRQGSSRYYQNVLLTAYVADNYDRPISIPPHTSVDVPVSLEVEADINKRQLIDTLASWEDPNFSRQGFSEVRIVYTLAFPDIKAVTTESTFCIYIK